MSGVSQTLLGVLGGTFMVQSRNLRKYIAVLWVSLEFYLSTSTSVRAFKKYRSYAPFFYCLLTPVLFLFLGMVSAYK